MTTIYAVLYNSGGELDRVQISHNVDDDSAELSTAIHNAIADWTLAVGDTIKIEGSE